MFFRSTRVAAAAVARAAMPALQRSSFASKSFDAIGTQEQAAAAAQCSCPLCMQDLLDAGRALHHVCSICSRRCCRVCSVCVENIIMCRSATCMAISKFNTCQLSLQALAGECDRICRDLLRQWVVLQFKAEIQLGPLRALLLVNAKHAALTSIAAKSSLLQTEVASTE